MRDRIQDRPSLDYIEDIARQCGITTVIDYHPKLDQNIVFCTARYPGNDSEVAFQVVIGNDGAYVRLIGEVDLGTVGQLRLANEWNNSTKIIGPAVPMTDGYLLTYCLTFAHGMTDMNFASSLILFGREMSEFWIEATESHRRQGHL